MCGAPRHAQSRLPGACSCGPHAALRRLGGQTFRIASGSAIMSARPRKAFGQSRQCHHTSPEASSGHGAAASARLRAVPKLAATAPTAARMAPPGIPSRREQCLCTGCDASAVHASHISAQDLAARTIGEATGSAEGREAAPASCTARFRQEESVPGGGVCPSLPTRHPPPATSMSMRMSGPAPQPPAGSFLAALEPRSCPAASMKTTALVCALESPRVSSSAPAAERARSAAAKTEASPASEPSDSRRRARAAAVTSSGEASHGLGGDLARRPATTTANLALGSAAAVAPASAETAPSTHGDVLASTKTT